MSKTLKNHLGEEVPVKYVPAIDLDKDTIARRTLKAAIELNARLEKFKLQLITECDGIYEQMKEDAEVRTGKKGNYTISSFDKSIKIEVNVKEKIEFGDEIKMAQEKLDDYLKEVTTGANKDLVTLVNSAFETTQGRLDTKRILGLFKLEIKHPTWLKAMELLKQSISRNVSKRYIRVWQKDEEGEYQNIKLDFSAI